MTTATMRYYLGECIPPELGEEVRKEILFTQYSHFSPQHSAETFKGSRAPVQRSSGLSAPPPCPFPVALERMAQWSASSTNFSVKHLCTRLFSNSCQGSHICMNMGMTVFKTSSSLSLTGCSVMQSCSCDDEGVLLYSVAGKLGQA